MALLGSSGQSMDVRRPEAEHLARTDDPFDTGHTNSKIVFEQLAAHHCHGARREVVIVPAGVVTRRPAQHPHVDVFIAVQASVVPVLVVERDLALPAGRDVRRTRITSVFSSFWSRFRPARVSRGGVVKAGLLRHMARVGEALHCNASLIARKVSPRQHLVTLMPVRERTKRVTLRDVATESGLSSAAVSYALRGIHVPIETQERVREVADRLGYQVDPIARALASGRTGYVGLLCGSLTDVWQQGIAADLGRGLLEHDRHALITDGAGDPALEGELATQLVDQRVDGLIVLSVDPSGKHWPVLARRNRAGLGGRQHSRCRDRRRGGVRQRRRCLGRARVPRRIRPPPHRGAHAVLDPHAGPARRCRSAEAAGRLGLEVDLHMSPHGPDGAAGVACAILDTADRPTAVFCLADSMAYGVYAAARDLGLSIPGDVSVLGFDDHQLSRLLTPPIVDVPVAGRRTRQLGRRAHRAGHRRRQAIAAQGADAGCAAARVGRSGD